MRASSAVVSIALFSAALTAAQGAKKDQGDSVLKTVADIPLPGPAVRFDYQSLDAKNGRLYISHMNANQLVVFDTRNRKVVPTSTGSVVYMASLQFRRSIASLHRPQASTGCLPWT